MFDQRYKINQEYQKTLLAQTEHQRIAQPFLVGQRKPYKNLTDRFRATRDNRINQTSNR